MGLGCAFLLVKGLSAPAVLAALGISPTADRITGEDALSTATSGGVVDLGTGWALLADPSAGRVDDAAVLAAHGPVLSLFVEEHVMASGAAGWHDGRQRWSVDCSDGQVVVSGEPPGIAELMALAPAADPEEAALFDVPAQLVAQHTGWAWDRMDDRLVDGPVWLPLPAPVTPPPSRRRWSRRR